MARSSTLLRHLGVSSALATSLLVAQPALADVPNVVVSIKPIHSLVAGVMDGVGEPGLLLEGNESPHSYSLVPSEAAMLSDADIVFWVGEDLETFLQRPLEALAGDAQHVSILEAPDMTLLPVREGGIWDEHAHGDDHGGHDDHADHDDHDDHDDHGDDDHSDHDHDDHADHDDHGDEDHADHDDHDDHGDEDHADHDDHDHAHDHSGGDPHVWLDPQNASMAVALIAETLSEADPANADRYAANAASVQEGLAQLHDDIAARLQPVTDRPFIVFHDAYQYFEQRFGLTPAGSITLSPEQAPGAQRLAALHERLDEQDVACVFSEPQFEPRVVAALAEGRDVGTAELDPLGAAIEPGPDAYATLLNGMADAIVGCLAENS
ncbi:MAG: zinc ABC transporter substrate-binding protein [Pseudomonadota bacterium]